MAYTDEKTYEPNEDVKILSPKYLSGDTQFVSWNTKEDGTGTSYKPGDTFKAGEDVNLYVVGVYNSKTIVNMPSVIKPGTSITYLLKFTVCKSIHGYR